MNNKFELSIYNSIEEDVSKYFIEGELDEKVVISKMETTTAHRATAEEFSVVHQESENTFTMEEFAVSINEFLSFRKYEILKNKGKISRKIATAKAEVEYKEFNITQKIISDFDREIRQLVGKEGDVDE